MILRTEQIERQKADFIRLGVLGDWDNPYLTMDFSTEADIIRALGKIHQKRLSLPGAKPVNWCIDCGSALAEAEVEYEDKNFIGHRCRLRGSRYRLHWQQGFDPFAASGISIEDTRYAVIWTTTPWTLPANQAVTVHPGF